MYEDFYGLTGKPFQLSPDPAFYFGSKGHSSAFSYLKYGVYQGEGFLVITGDIGTGKTTLVRALLDELDTREVVAAQIVSTQLDADDLLRSVAAAFGINVAADGKARLLATIEAFLLTTFQRGKRALLIVDEAQNLGARSLEELRMLSNFQCGDQRFAAELSYRPARVAHADAIAANGAVPAAGHRVISPRSARSGGHPRVRRTPAWPCRLEK